MSSPGLTFFERLLGRGEAVFDGPPDWLVAERPQTVKLLDAAYATHRLTVSGPRLEFRPETAFVAARFLVEACWALASGESQELKIQAVPASAADHLSADLCLRYLGTVHRRVRMRPPDDALQAAVVDVLTRWPLSGVVADIDAPPIGELSFSDHHGLQLLYAERLAAKFRPAWLPAGGRTREVVELVFQQQGRRLPTPAEAAP